MTNVGINRALQIMEECRYVGPAPVSLDEYRYAIEIQTIKAIEVTFEDLKKPFRISSLVMRRLKLMVRQ